MKLNKKMRSLLNASSIGISVVAAILIGTAMGVYLDKVFNTKPYLTMVFMVLGIIAGFKNIIYFIKRTDLYDENGD
ncbi:AtpZ/AtpI family protein [Deferribacter autotrophicus]|uniref:AtpZ/AtpI family protein n=1 Tax=Deferribacter autotrophicus TaxID=500465 RepID=A0A5A8F353_9BACT|nr:AtpZ/AtpI family protein [Deferribacter autotrophicus]KAA0258437.1 AtpZ/AtpI family protein [Deferribacter autotrophicus]